MYGKATDISKTDIFASTNGDFKTKKNLNFWYTTEPLQAKDPSEQTKGTVQMACSVS